MNNLNSKLVVKRLQKQIDSIFKAKKEEESKEDVKVEPREIELFFGPSKEFSHIFKLALIQNSKKEKALFDLH